MAHHFLTVPHPLSGTVPCVELPPWSGGLPLPVVTATTHSATECFLCSLCRRLVQVLCRAWVQPTALPPWWAAARPARQATRAARGSSKDATAAGDHRCAHR